MDAEPERSEISTLRVVVFYAVITAMGVGWAALRGRNPFFLTGAPRPGEAASVALGTGLGLLGVGLSRLLDRHFAWARALDHEFRRLLGDLRPGQVLTLAVASSVAEEVLFRGALLPSLGLLGSSLVFAILHVGPNRRFLPWPILAFVLGLALGGLFLVTGDLLAPILAHFTLNFFNLHQFRREPAITGPH